MPRGSFRWHEPKKPKKGKQKVVSPEQIVARLPEPEVVSKGKTTKKGEEPEE
ncbi:MAG: hypothetical protein HYY31_05435 [Chloroflexi bacterium]|nr:hypothetical protein [Chloroflexota bacterium]